MIQATLSYNFIFAGPQPRAAQAIQINGRNGSVGGTTALCICLKTGSAQYKNELWGMKSWL
jgi:hypothetical protein